MLLHSRRLLEMLNAPPMETHQRPIPGHQVTPLNVTHEVRRRSLTDHHGLDASRKRGQPVQIAAQARFVIAVLLLKMLRLQEHALAPENGAQWLHSTSSTAESLLTTNRIWRTVLHNIAT